MNGCSLMKLLAIAGGVKVNPQTSSRMRCAATSAQ